MTFILMASEIARLMQCLTSFTVNGELADRPCCILRSRAFVKLEHTVISQTLMP